MAVPCCTGGSIKASFNIAILAILAVVASANSFNNAGVDHEPKNASAYLPPILSSCLTPLSPSATVRWSQSLISHEKKIKNISSFCNDAGLICDESIETPSAQLHKFSTYRLPKTTNINFQLDNMFFKESLLSLGSLIKLPMKEPHIPTRAFLPPLLEPPLFNHSTSLFLDVLQSFGFQAGTPLANSMQQTLQICNTPPTRGERKACVATFEDMLDFATSSIGSANTIALASATLPHEQTVILIDVHEVTQDGERATVACHNAMFPFQVFYCHHIQGTKVFEVMLQTTMNEITNILAIASCHPLDTTPQFPPSSHKNLEQKELLCHWNYGDNIVWIPMTNLSSPLVRYTK